MTPPSSKRLQRRRKRKGIKLKYGKGKRLYDIPAFGVGFSFYD